MLDTINQDIKTAMKEKNKDKLQALRYLKAMMIENSVSKAPIPEIDVLVSHHKKLKDSLKNFPDGHHIKLQTEAELAFLEPYLPAPLSEQEVIIMINNIKATSEATNMGGIMKELQPMIKGRFDGKKASELVKASVS